MRLHNSLVCKKCQVKPLVEDIKANRKRINISGKRTQRGGGGGGQGTLSCLYFVYIWSLFVVASSKSILHHDNLQKQKLKDLCQNLVKRSN